MRRVRTPLLAGALVAAAFGVAQAATAEDQPARDYIVVYAEGASSKAARAAIADAGGSLVKENSAIGVATVSSKNSDFVADATAETALLGAANNRPIGRSPGARSDQFRIEKGDAPQKGSPPRGAPPAAEPLSGEQWDMRMIGATPEGSYRKQPGSRQVRVGIIDTGIDGSHPDIAPNFDGRLSRNFTTDKPDIDGPCEEEPDQSCSDPANVDEAGHGTHVAGTIGSPINGVGIAGVAPNVTLVNLRAGQDSGYFFLQPSIDALTYAGDNGIDVVNMSYYIDPWLYNCRNYPGDSPAEQREQRTIIAATQRALDYARNRGVTLVAAMGNQDDDLGAPEPDTLSPDYPEGSERPRQVDNSCLSMPTEGEGVISVSAVGPSKRKAFYSNYGTEQTSVSAPGGDSRDTATGLANPRNRILAPYPAPLAQADLADPRFAPLVVQQGGAYYEWLQGTSMASPHAVGVAALIVSEYGERDRRHHGGLKLDPATTERILRRTATDTPCPEPRLYDYPEPSSGDQYTAYCDGPPSNNGFYGDGIVDADRAVSRRHR
jgi:subtilisin family serine protease